MKNDKSLVSLLAESLIGVISKNGKMNGKERKNFYAVTGLLSGFMNRQYSCNDNEVRLTRYVSQRAMLNGMKDDEFVDAVSKADNLKMWEDLMFYNYV